VAIPPDCAGNSTVRFAANTIVAEEDSTPETMGVRLLDSTNFTLEVKPALGLNRRTDLGKFAP